MRRGVDLVAVETAVLGDGVVLESLVRIDGSPGGSLVAQGVGGVPPSVHVVTGDADRRHLVGSTEEVAQLVVVRIVAGGAVHLAVATKGEVGGDDLRGTKLPIGVG